MMAVPMAAAFWGPMSTAAVLVTLHVLAELSGKNFSPQFTSACVSLTTCMIAGVTWAHFELGPQPMRSEERRVGKEGRSRWSPYPSKKKNAQTSLVRHASGLSATNADAHADVCARAHRRAHSPLSRCACVSANTRSASLFFKQKTAYEIS